MPRIGMNPARGQVTDYRPSRVTLAVLTYLPNDAGYFQERFDVTRLCLESLIANTTPPSDLLVFDNGSSAPLVDFLRSLRDQGLIRYLLLSSQNIGKIGALQMIFRAAPGEIVAYTDDDVYFLPGWLDAHLQLIDTYPRVGMVTGFYIRTRMGDYVRSTLEFTRQPGVETERGLLIPKAWEEEYRVNSGRTPESYASEVANLEDVALRYRGVEALASAHHFQFVAPREIFLQALPKGWSGKLMGQLMEVEKTIDEAGYLRLCTRQQTVHLLGNRLNPEMVQRAQELGMENLKKAKPEGAKPGGVWAPVLKYSWLRRIAQGIYNRLHEVLNG
ncbi:MAG: glycosyltransferase family 2 protein [Chloroflexi bacterium]|nr:glycosyltransferase family 2 protein [Chloroflexota bacterium]